VIAWCLKAETIDSGSSFSSWFPVTQTAV